MPSSFLSYSTNDFEIAQHLFLTAEELEYFIWFDIIDLPILSDWKVAIQNAINDSDSIILLVSRNSIHSEYVLEECRMAIESGKLIYALLIDNVLLPEFIASCQQIYYADLRENPFSKSLLTSFINDIKFDPATKWTRERTGLILSSVFPPELLHVSRVIKSYGWISSAVCAISILVSFIVADRLGGALNTIVVFLLIAVVVTVNQIWLPRVHDQMLQRNISSIKLLLNFLLIGITTTLIPIVPIIPTLEVLDQGAKGNIFRPNIAIVFWVLGYLLVCFTPGLIILPQYWKRRDSFDFVLRWLPQTTVATFGLADISNILVERTAVKPANFDQIQIIHHAIDHKFANFLLNFLMTDERLRGVSLELVDISKDYIPADEGDNEPISIVVISPFLSEIWPSSSRIASIGRVIPILFQHCSAYPESLSRIHHIDARRDYQYAAKAVLSVLADEFHNEIYNERPPIKPSFFGPHPWPDELKAMFGMCTFLIGWHALGGIIYSLKRGFPALALWIAFYAIFAGRKFFFKCYWERRSSVELLIPISLIYGVSISTVTFEIQIAMADRFYPRSVGLILVIALSLIPLASALCIGSRSLRNRIISPKNSFEIWMPSLEFEFLDLCYFILLSLAFTLIGLWII